MKFVSLCYSEDIVCCMLSNLQAPELIFIWVCIIRPLEEEIGHRGQRGTNPQLHCGGNSGFLLKVCVNYNRFELKLETCQGEG